MLVEVKVQSLGLDRASNTPVVILRETEGERILPIWIGPGEASAIAMRLADMNFSRPLTHDLLAHVLNGLGGSLRRVVITRVEENTYYAELVIQRNGDVFTVDARPSDSIAVALRLEAEIFADDSLLRTASVEISGEEEGTVRFGEGEETPEQMSADELQDYLRRLNPEDFGRFSP